jgi:hypothetical protein
MRKSRFLGTTLEGNPAARLPEPDIVTQTADRPILAGTTDPSRLCTLSPAPLESRDEVLHLGLSISEDIAVAQKLLLMTPQPDR